MYLFHELALDTRLSGYLPPHSAELANYLIYNKREWNNCFIKFFKLQTSVCYNRILVNFILNITKRPDIKVTSGKPREIT